MKEIKDKPKKKTKPLIKVKRQGNYKAPEHGFKPGNKLGGRPKGSRNRFAEEFFKDFMADWEKSGVKAIQDVRKKDPSTYLRVAASLVPKEFNINSDDVNLDKLLEGMSDEDLNNTIAGLQHLGSIATCGKEAAAKATTRAVTDELH